MEFLPKEQCQKVLYLCIILLHDINYIIVLSYGFHIMFNMFNKQDCKNGNTNKPNTFVQLTCKAGLTLCDF